LEEESRSCIWNEGEQFVDGEDADTLKFLEPKKVAVTGSDGLGLSSDGAGQYSIIVRVIEDGG
jgi:hypothetical protein